MKITKETLKKLIIEELEAHLKEEATPIEEGTDNIASLAAQVKKITNYINGEHATEMMKMSKRLWLLEKAGKKASPIVRSRYVDK